MKSPEIQDLPPWGDWSPIDRATLVFIRCGEQVLLIRKLRGLGAGKINGPGGRIEAGEAIFACARREVEEELCVTPTGLELRGELRFQFVDGHSIQAFVFSATGYAGEPQSTDEAIPQWTHQDAIPYDQMWADDRLWLPLLLAGNRFKGRFLFEGEQMLLQDVVIEVDD